MPPHFIPRKSSAHRIACKALYRALLSQCPRIALPPDYPSQGAINPIKHLIRKSFKKNIHVVSARIVVAGLEAGYKAEILLRTAGDGKQSSIYTLHAKLWDLHHAREDARAVCQKPRPAALPPRITPFPNAPKTLSVRPVPASQLTGRRVPGSLASANGIPFLRFKKPQSPFLSRVLRDKMKQKIRRFEKGTEIDELVEVAALENAFYAMCRERVWDESEEVGGAEGKRMRGWLELEGRWLGEDLGDDMKGVGRKVWSVAKNAMVENVERAVRIQAIVETEERLRDEERREKKEAKWRDHVKRKFGKGDEEMVESTLTLWTKNDGKKGKRGDGGADAPPAGSSF